MSSNFAGCPVMPPVLFCTADDEIRECVLTSLDERFDAHLAQADNLTTLFVAMHDGVSTHTQVHTSKLPPIYTHNPHCCLLSGVPYQRASDLLHWSP